MTIKDFRYRHFCMHLRAQPWHIFDLIPGYWPNFASLYRPVEVLCFTVEYVVLSAPALNAYLGSNVSWKGGCIDLYDVLHRLSEKCFCC
jgi:hypothetical protein